MFQIRRSNERGRSEFGWLSSRHSFSFGSYADPMHTDFGPLRVLNEDRVQPGKGFGTHAHEDMEIISYVLEGTVVHRDSTGTEASIHYGDVQRMTAGTGVEHSEFNPSPDTALHFLQIWIRPDRRGLRPEYEERHFGSESKRGRLCLIASRDARSGSLLVHQDVSVYASILGSGDEVRHALVPGRSAYVHVARGRILANGHSLESGDALKLVDEDAVTFNGAQDAELLLFDLPVRRE